ncbi:hypothetical protein ETAA8_15600 [Anatilimnocola aggregata]|uniref:Carboxypeptidase regulatory-like domain-containing protein n=1 Tax=Anatilimnocola aggregata TaxID=2528021 RepID=A0A517Y8L6_9BACT|nr:DUF4198 domain-containing protein [Anatilimnocola aggregata]QDU26482.1 hypothetical protein ETAA8_15600 [Anatilimnocola aggregata]
MRNLLIPLVLCVTFAGCGAQGPATIPVSGVVTFDGKPLSGAMITFVPQGDTSGRGGLAQTDDEGKFVARTQDGKTIEGIAGLVPGQYKVLVNKLVKPDGTLFVPTEEQAPIDANAREVIPLPYSDFERTTLTAEVNEAVQPLTFELRSRRS